MNGTENNGGEYDKDEKRGPKLFTNRLADRLILIQCAPEFRLIQVVMFPAPDGVKSSRLKFLIGTLIGLFPFIHPSVRLPSK